MTGQALLSLRYRRCDEGTRVLSVVHGFRELHPFHCFEGIHPFDRKCRLRIVDRVYRIVPVGIFDRVGGLAAQPHVVWLRMVGHVPWFSARRAEAIASRSVGFVIMGCPERVLRPGTGTRG